MKPSKSWKKEEAQQMLAEIYGWFTEGFNTQDLQEAKALLIALEGETKDAVYPAQGHPAAKEGL